MSAKKKKKLDLFLRALTDTGGLMLSETRRTLAGEAADGVDAEELTVVLLG